MPYRIGKGGSVYRVKKRGNSRRKTFKKKSAALRAARSR